MPRKLTFIVVLEWDSTRVRLCFLTYKSNCVNPMTTDESVKLELLKLTIELAKFAYEKNIYASASHKDPEGFKNTFDACHKLLNDTYCQEGILQTNQPQTSDE